MTKDYLIEEIKRIENNIEEMGKTTRDIKEKYFRKSNTLKRFKKEELKNYLEEITERNYILYYN